MRKTITTIAATATLFLAGLVVAPSASAAVYCPNVHVAASTYTVVTSQVSGCGAQARIYRYYNSTIITVTGTMQPYGSASEARDSRGVNAGNAMRFNDGGTLGTWIWI